MTRWTFRQVLACWIGSSCLTLSLFILGLMVWCRSVERKLIDPQNKIVSIIQTGPEKEALKTVYLAELLSISVDQFTSLYALDLGQAKEKLLASPLISSALIKKIAPDTLYIDYEVRKPMARLSDYQNMGVDRSGYVFPLAPFFSPKELPEIYLGLPSFGAHEDRWGRKGATWSAPIQNRYFSLALDVLKYFEETPWKEGVRLKKIDVSNAFALSLGQREIVLFTEEDFRWTKDGEEICSVCPKILRLAPKDYPQQINHFFTLRRNMAEDYKRQLAKISQSVRFQPRIIDLRIPQLAFVENHS